MENYVIENGDEGIDKDKVSQATIGETVHDELIAVQESATIEKDETLSEVIDPRRLGKLRLIIGFTITSIASNLIIGGNPKFYPLLTIGLIWILIGIKEFLFPKQ